MARYRRYGYRSRSRKSSSVSRAKPPRFPKGSLADWEKRYAALNRLLQEAIAKDAADEIKNQIKGLASSKPTYGEDAAYWRYQMEQKLKQERKQQREATAAQRAAAKAEREAATAEREEAKKRKAEAERAAVASAIGKAREHADNVKRSLRKDHDCPYCGSELGDQPHADHIYPLSKGGRSVAVNMVYVCAVCNVKKADMTLAAFVAAYRLDRDTIESRLLRLCKEY